MPSPRECQTQSPRLQSGGGPWEISPVAMRPQPADPTSLLLLFWPQGTCFSNVSELWARGPQAFWPLHGHRGLFLKHHFFPHPVCRASNASFSRSLQGTLHIVASSIFHLLYTTTIVCLSSCLRQRLVVNMQGNVWIPSLPLPSLPTAGTAEHSQDKESLLFPTGHIISAEIYLLDTRNVIIGYFRIVPKCGF